MQTGTQRKSTGKHVRSILATVQTYLYSCFKFIHYIVKFNVSLILTPLVTQGALISSPGWPVLHIEPLIKVM